MATVVVIGAGPAGCAAAGQLAREGNDVLLLEYSGPGRDKACGDMFMDPAVEVLLRLGLTIKDFEQIGGRRFDDITLAYDGRFLWSFSYQMGAGWMLPRRSIDQCLRDRMPPQVKVLYHTIALSVSVLDNSTLQVFTRTNGGGMKALTCQGLVLACGSSNKLAASLGVGGEPDLGIALSTYTTVRDLKSPKFEFSKRLDRGYFWSFPIDQGIANCGVCFLYKAKGHYLKEMGTSWIVSEKGGSNVRWRGGYGALWSGKGSIWHLPYGIVSCGDAAGLIDPLTGEGLTAALITGEQAGAAMSRFLAEDRDETYLAQYSQWVRHYFQGKYASSPIRNAWRQFCGF